MATSEQLLYGVPTWHQVTSVNNNTASTATAAACVSASAGDAWR